MTSVGKSPEAISGTAQFTAQKVRTVIRGNLSPHYNGGEASPMFDVAATQACLLR
jgi:hypothetical protein